MLVVPVFNLFLLNTLFKMRFSLFYFSEINNDLMSNFKPHLYNPALHGHDSYFYHLLLRAMAFISYTKHLSPDVNLLNYR